MRALVVKRKTGAESGSQAFVNQIDATAACFMHGVAYRTLLDCGRGTRNTHNVMSAAETISHVADERAQHFLRDFVVEDRARANGPMHLNAPRLASQQPQRFVSD